jgi:hypothetical protein
MNSSASQALGTEALTGFFNIHGFGADVAIVPPPDWMDREVLRVFARIPKHHMPAARQESSCLISSTKYRRKFCLQNTVFCLHLTRTSSTFHTWLTLDFPVILSTNCRQQ